MKHFNPIDDLQRAFPKWVIDDYNNAKPHQEELVALKCSEHTPVICALSLMILIGITALFFSDVVAFITNDMKTNKTDIVGLFFSVVSFVFLYTLRDTLLQPSKMKARKAIEKAHNINIHSIGAQMVVEKIDIAPYIAMKNKQEHELTSEDWGNLCSMYNKDTILPRSVEKSYYCQVKHFEIKEKTYKTCGANM